MEINPIPDDECDNEEILMAEVADITRWAVDRVEEVEPIGYKDAIYKEFEEWIEETEGVEVISIDFQ